VQTEALPRSSNILLAKPAWQRPEQRHPLPARAQMSCDSHATNKLCRLPAPKHCPQGNNKRTKACCGQEPPGSCGQWTPTVRVSSAPLLPIPYLDHNVITGRCLLGLIHPTFDHVKTTLQQVLWATGHIMGLAGMSPYTPSHSWAGPPHHPGPETMTDSTAATLILPRWQISCQQSVTPG
jgi:hypothetical protein